MRCPHCQHTALSIPRYATLLFGPVWRKREVPCKNCGVMLRPASWFMRRGIHVGGLAAGMGVAVALLPVLPLTGMLRTIVAVAVAVSIDALIGHRFTRYELVDPGAHSLLPASTVIRGADNKGGNGIE